MPVRLSLLSLVLAATLSTSLHATASCGDVTGDGSVDVLDAFTTARFSAGIGTLTAEQLRLADVNRSGATDITDALLIAQSVVGLGTSLNCTGETTKVYVADEGPTSFVVIVDHDTAAILGSLPLPAAPTSMAADPVRARLYVGLVTGDVAIVDTMTDALIGSFPVPGLVGDMAVTPDGTTLVGTTVTGLAVLDLPAGSPRHDVVTTAPDAGNHVACAPDSTTAWMTQKPAANVVKIDLVAGTVLDTIPVGTNPFGIAVTPDGQIVWVVNTASQELSRIDVATGLEILPRGPLGTVPFGVTARDNGNAFAVNCFAANVSQHDRMTGASIGSPISCGFDPMEIHGCESGNIVVTDSILSQAFLIEPDAGIVHVILIAGHAVDVASK